MSTLAGLTVAFVILADIATGQGPQALNNYLAVLGGPDYRSPPPPGPLPLPPQPVIVYPPTDAYEAKKVGDPKVDKEYQKEKEKEKEIVKSEIYANSAYGPGYDVKSTPTPGVLASFSNSMSDAWKSFTNLGRQTRGARYRRSVDTEVDADAVKILQKGSSPKGKTGARSMDEYEWRQFNNQGTLYFKVPRALICSSGSY